HPIADAQSTTIAAVERAVIPYVPSSQASAKTARATTAVAILPDVRLARVCRTGLAVVVSVALFTWSNDAYAEKKPPKHPGASSVDQYRESIPTASGPSYAESGAPTTSARRLAPAVVVRLAHVAGRQAARLELAATSPQYGA